MTSKSRGAAKDLSHGCAKRKRDSAQHQEKAVVVSRENNISTVGATDSLDSFAPMALAQTTPSTLFELERGRKARAYDRIQDA
jgi:hypothetical protein